MILSIVSDRKRESERAHHLRQSIRLYLISWPRDRLNDKRNELDSIENTWLFLFSTELFQWWIGNMSYLGSIFDMMTGFSSFSHVVSRLLFFNEYLLLHARDVRITSEVSACARDEKILLYFCSTDTMFRRKIGNVCLWKIIAVDGEKYARWKRCSHNLSPSFSHSRANKEEIKND